MTQVDHDKLLEQALTRCASEPIHLAGAIQGHGVLLAFDRDGIVRMASDNLKTLFCCLAAESIGRPVADLIGQRSLDAVLANLDESGTTAYVATAIEGQLLWRRAARPFGHAFERRPQGAGTQAGDDPRRGNHRRLFKAARQSIWRFDKETNIKRYCQYVAEEMRMITGFDRVKVLPVRQPLERGGHRRKPEREAAFSARPSLPGPRHPAPGASPV